jgi:anhydro-N-acetylmuramic acid kinase
MIFAPQMSRKAGKERRWCLCFIARLRPRRAFRSRSRGVANLSFIAPGKEPIACDTGPGNGLLDDLMLKRRGLPFDRDGAAGSRGKADSAVLSALLAHPFFRAPPPKSLDRNDFLGTAVESLATEDAAATLTAFTAASIAGVLPLLPSRPSFAIVCGGGARNKTLLRELADRLPCPVVMAETFGWSSDAMEAQAFAYLAARREKNLPITFPMTTGVDKPLEGGVIAEPGVA